MRVLSKSRFKLGLQCPNKLFFTGKKDYANQKNEDSFLMALAEGGFQVEEMARLHYPYGHLLEGNDGEHELLHKKTQELLQNENVVIYEAAFLLNNLFVRTDILVKTGNEIKLIEVKAKSFDSTEENTFMGKRGGIVSSWKPYLFDLAFQSYVIKMAHPFFKVSSYLMLADKNKTAQVNGLNQKFRITKNANNRTGIVKTVKSLEETGGTVLSEIEVTDIIDGIQSDRYSYSENIFFSWAVKYFSRWYQEDTYPLQTQNFGACKNCEFRNDDNPNLKSGVHFCFEKHKGFKPTDLSKPNIFEVWNFRKGSKIFDDGRFFLSELVEEDIAIKHELDGMSATERQWMQIEKSRSGDCEPYLDKEALNREMSTWKFPLQFIDFETSAVALPFMAGLRPYEQIAFQFSLHTIDDSGKITHAAQYLNASPGEFPNFNFVRELKYAIGDKGTIFRFATHENSILNAIIDQLESSDETDKLELIEFIKTITESTSDGTDSWVGERNMVDLCELIRKFYYNPLTKGSNSIKAVLPAVLATDKIVREKYSKPISEVGLASLNFDSRHTWLKYENGNLLSPYKSLPALFNGWTDEQLDSLISDMEVLSDGGAAMTAYSTLQFADMSVQERKEIESALLKYCELDTLAMVMIYEHFVNLVRS